jgi:hypothetical protein
MPASLSPKVLSFTKENMFPWNNMYNVVIDGDGFPVPVPTPMYGFKVASIPQDCTILMGDTLIYNSNLDTAHDKSKPIMMFSVGSDTIEKLSEKLNCDLDPKPNNYTMYIVIALLILFGILMVYSPGFLRY